MKKIGEGMTAIILSDGRYAYKSYKEGYDTKNMLYEIKIQNEIYQSTDLNVAQYELENDMIKMTLLDGENLADRLVRNSDIKPYTDFIDLQIETFKYQDLALPNAYEVFRYQINQSNARQTLKDQAIASLDHIDKTLHLCHFDYHPENIIYHQDKPYIIDWNNAKLGNPVMDIASTYIIFLVYAKDYAQMYLEAMIEKGFVKSEILNAIPLMAYIRYIDTVVEDEKDKKVLEELIMKY